jgi:hypothetical protein
MRRMRTASTWRDERMRLGLRRAVDHFILAGND